MRTVLRRALALALAAATVVSLGTVPALGPRGPAGPAAGAAGSPAGAVEVAPAYVPAAGVTPLGSVPANASLEVAVGLASRDPAGLSAYVAATEVPGTSTYRHFLSASEAARRFGALPGSVARAEEYFEGFGLAATAHPDGLLLSISGPAAALGAALGTTFERFQNASGGVFVAHTTPAVLPGVAPWTGVYGLGNVSTLTPAVRGAEPVPVAAGAGCPTSASYLTACDVATAYDFAGLDANGTNGTGERIAVVDAFYAGTSTTTFAHDFATFTTDEGLPGGGLSFEFPGPTTPGQNGTGTVSAWALESALDIEWARASAPGASVELVLSPNAGAGIYYAVDWVVATHAADVLSMSWGEPEVGVFNAVDHGCASACNASSDGTLAILGPVLELGAAEGISAFAASGDCGSADGTSGLAVNFPASSPYVTGVGATNLTIAPNGTYAQESAWGGNQSGARAPGCDNDGGSGGGFSVAPRPAWQTGTGTVASRGRGVPDVSVVGGPLHRLLVIVASGVVTPWGTSVGTPIWAGIAATADQEAGGPLGLLDPALYRVLGSPAYPHDFHDITSGSNGYHAGAGWDPITGLGSPNVAALLPNLTAGATTVSNLGTSVFVAPRFGRAPLTVTATVAPRGGSGSYPIQGVAFGDGNASSVVGGRANHTFEAPGVYSVQSYVVDATGATAASPPVVVVVGTGTPLTVGLTASTASPTVGANVTFNATVAGGQAPYVYNFTFGDGDQSLDGAAASVVHPYPVSGGFCAEVVVHDSRRPADGGASARVAIAVGGASPPACGNPAHPLTLTANASVGVRDAPADFPQLFSFAGGSTAPNGLGPQIGYASPDPYTAACDCALLRRPGTFTVDGWVNDTVNGEARAEVNVTVAPALNATFNASTLFGTVPLRVVFTASAFGGYDASAAATHWSFGSLGHAVGASAAVTYTTPGEYLAVASLSDSGHGNASEAFLLDAEAPGSSSPGLTATVSPAVNVSSGTTVHWSGDALGPSTVLAGTRLVWNLGNGAEAFGPVANETYYASTDLLAADTLAGGFGLDSATLSPILQQPIDLGGFFADEPGGFVPEVNAMVLRAALAPTAGAVPLEVNGTASVHGPDVSLVAWLFGDGSSAVGDRIAHNFYGGGDYTVTVRAYDAYGHVASRLIAIEANQALALTGCTPPTRHGSAPYTVELKPGPVGGAGAPYRYLWSLPQGGSSTAENVSLTFRSAGTYTAQVLVTDPSNATAVCAWTIVVAAPPAVGPPLVLVVGGAAGAVLTGVFLWATRPVPRRRPAPAVPVSP